MIDGFEATVFEKFVEGKAAGAGDVTAAHAGAGFRFGCIEASLGSGINGLGFRGIDGGENLLGGVNHFGVEGCLEFAVGFWGGKFVLGGTIFFEPFGETAVEDDDFVVPHDFKHPPGSG